MVPHYYGSPSNEERETDAATAAAGFANNYGNRVSTMYGARPGRGMYGGMYENSNYKDGRWAPGPLQQKMVGGYTAGSMGGMISGTTPYNADGMQPGMNIYNPYGMNMNRMMGPRAMMYGGMGGSAMSAA